MNPASAERDSIRNWWRRAPGILVLVPLVALLWGTYWTVLVPQRPKRLEVIRGTGPDRTVRPFFFTRLRAGAVPGEESRLPRDAVLTVEFPRPLQDAEVVLLTRGKDKFVLRGVRDGGGTQILWEANRKPQAGGRLVKHSLELSLATPMRHFQCFPHWKTDGGYLSALRFYRQVRISQLWLLPLCWLPFALAGLLGAFPAAHPRAAKILAGLERADAPAATALVFTVFFQLTPVTLGILAGLVLLAAWGSRFRRPGGRRLPLPALVFNVLFLYLFLRFAPAVVEKFIVYRTASDYHLDVDHRMKPNGQEINADGIRFKRAPADVRAEDFNVVFMGDSFCYGMKLPYDDTVPYTFERLAAERGCRPRVCSINFGWVSSSPMLGYRLLMDIGAKYQPDLAVYLLDMSDFFDDIKYAAKVSRKEGVKFNSSLLLDNLVERLLLKTMSVTTLRKVKEAVRPLAAAQREKERDLLATDDQYFATNIPYERAVPYMQRGVMKNLELIHAWCRDRLGVPLVVVLVPRSYQYSTRECPLNYENKYTILGPHVLNPFRFFAEVKSALPYPVLDLLPVFKQSQEFPLYFADDPHWNPAGARLAAQTLLDFLAGQSLLPCVP